MHATTPRRRRTCTTLVAALLLATAAAAAERPSLAGKSLVEAIEVLRGEGLAVFYSSALVTPAMRVRGEPPAGDPRRALDALLRPHGLAVEAGPGGTLLVVERRPAPIVLTPPEIHGAVVERASRRAIAGVEVLLDDAGARALSAGDGTFRFTGIAAGSHRLEARKPGFVVQQLHRVEARPGHRAEVLFELTPAPPALDEITVTPLLDPRRMQLGTTLGRVELEAIPTARDPWAVVTQTPGVISDRVNVGGSESGQQAVFVGPGQSVDENSFAIDGVETTDMAAIGASVMYYDFEHFDELQITTGGADVTTTAPGVSLRMVTKRGTNQPRGSSRLLLADSDGLLGLLRQGNARVDDALADGQPALQGNQVDRVLEYGAEAGGPLYRDRVWLWGAASRTEIDAFAAGGDTTQRGLADDTRLEHGALKVNAQPLLGNAAVVSLVLSDKRKPSRGAAPDRSLETTLRQRGPSAVVKLEDTHLFGATLYLTGQLSLVDGGFELTARGGAGASGGEAVLDADGIWRGGFPSGRFDRDAGRLALDGSYLLSAGGLDHQLTFGAAYRRFETTNVYRYPGPWQAFNIACENLTGCGTVSDDTVTFQRLGEPSTVQRYRALWLQDLLTAARTTWSLGLRYDHQDGINEAGRAEANPALPAVLPAIAFDGNDAGFDWRTVAPRLGLARTLGAGGRSLLRASAARFVGQLATADVDRRNPLDEAFVTAFFDDLDGDNVWQPGEPLTALGGTGVDLRDPASTTAPDRTDPGLDPELTDELAVTFEHTPRPNLVLAVTATWRHIHGIHEEVPLVVDPSGGVARPATAADYVLETRAQVTLPDGRPASVDLYALSPTLRRTGGTLLTNGDRERTYGGIGLRLTRRLSRRFMIDAHLDWGETTWRVPASYRAAHDPTDLAGDGDRDGELYAVQSRAGGKEDIFLQSTWSGNVRALVQIAPERRWGFHLAANLFARQGYPLPYYAGLVSAIDGVAREAQVSGPVDAFRADDLWVLDLRLEKEITWRGRLRTTFGLDVFNVFNQTFVLQRERNLSSARADYLDETLAPRMMRFGVRLSWP